MACCIFGKSMGCFMSEMVSLNHIKAMAKAAAETAPLGTNAGAVSPWPIVHPAYPVFEREFLETQNTQLAEEVD